MNITLSWPKVLTSLAAIALTVGGVVWGGYWLMFDKLLGKYDESLSRIEGTANAAEPESAADLLRSEFSALRGRLDAIGNELIATNKDIGAQVGQLRGELIGKLNKNELNINNRFDRLDTKMDNLMQKIGFNGERPIDLYPGSFTFDVKARYPMTRVTS